MMDELYKALETIKKECNKHENCSTCPLRNSDDGCALRESGPYDWQLRDDKEYIPRLFD